MNINTEALQQTLLYVPPTCTQQIVQNDGPMAAPTPQVEEVRNPALREVPLGVTQKYLIVTANYPASGS